MNKKQLELCVKLLNTVSDLLDGEIPTNLWNDLQQAIDSIELICLVEDVEWKGGEDLSPFAIVGCLLNYVKDFPGENEMVGETIFPQPEEKESD